MTELLEHMPWDTEFFGVEIARIEFGRETDEALVDAVDAEARRRGIQCLYASADPTTAQPSYLLQERGFRLVEVAVLIERRADSPLRRFETDSICRWGVAADVDRLGDAIAGLAPWSRFAMDPRFGLAAAERLMDAWMRRAAAPGDDRRRLAVAEDESGITAFATTVMEEVPVIDLIVTTRPSAGAAPTLVAFVFDELGAEGRGGPISARNVAVTRFTSDLGYRPKRVRYLFHKWYD